ncbi:TetR family transcriptional regulator [Nakamurella leprariae]|uniref:TetR family transcriptional regulator n=1 Tax=Nakamurella leprariae TaxID=2803911 RepID=A0A938YD50_9ACTN|nr:TetR family transcriptional regulator [Nakamurella leprariae]MBM9468482.1 TetR family transcriptional regulator [Nakamurella leprariae]
MSVTDAAVADPVTDAEHPSERPDLRERRRQATSAEISAAAFDLFERQGVDGTTVEDIARTAGISPRTFFRYFPCKEEAVLTVQREFDCAIADVLALIGARPDPAAPPVAVEEVGARVLSAVVAAYVRVIDEFGDRRAAAGATLLRVRRLIRTECALRTVAMRMDNEGDERLAQAIAAAVDLPGGIHEARGIVQIAGLGVRLALDEWATRVEAGEAVTPAEIYRGTRRMLERVVAPIVTPISTAIG